MVKLAISNNVTDAGFDGVVVVTNGPESLSPKFELLKSALIDYKKVNINVMSPNLSDQYRFNISVLC